MNSPCVSICRLDAMGKYCVGCGRTIDQIRNHYLDGLKNDTYSISEIKTKTKTQGIQKPYSMA